jgi:Xaa-Pro aminopeptidase
MTIFHHLPPARPTAYSTKNPPFNAELLDRLMEEANLDVLLITSKHNVQYFLGGYSFIFFSYKEAIGLSRYLPIVVYVRGRPDETAYFGNALEAFGHDEGVFWPQVVSTRHWGTTDAIGAAAAYVTRIVGDRVRIGTERAFLPLDAADALRHELPRADFAEAYFVLEELRRIKSPAELDLLRLGSEAVVEAMQTVFGTMAPGMSKADLVERLRSEETARGLIFEYCLITAGTSCNRAVGTQTLAPGDIVSLDSGANLRGWVGDLCRMGILGQPDSQLEDLLSDVDGIQQAARQQIRPGATGQEIFAAAAEAIGRTAHGGYCDFLAHGMGLVAHEAPRLTDSGPVPYPADGPDRPLEPGVVISVETAIRHPVRGYIKLEDTVAVTSTGCVGFGDDARGWNRPGQAA